MWRRLTTSSRGARAIWLLGAVVIAALLVQTWTRAERPGGIDLTSYLEAARIVARGGGNPYSQTASAPYIYPLFLAFALIPLAYVPAPAALLIWFVASIAALLWTTRTMLRIAYPELD